MDTACSGLISTSTASADVCRRSQPFHRDYFGLMYPGLTESFKSPSLSERQRCLFVSAWCRHTPFPPLCPTYSVPTWYFYALQRRFIPRAAYVEENKSWSWKPRDIPTLRSFICPCECTARLLGFVHSAPGLGHCASSQERRTHSQMLGTPCY